MSKVLLSIKPKYAYMIFDGDKKWEYRRKLWKRYGVDTVVVYASAPISKVIGEFRIAQENSLHQDSIGLAELWWRTYKESGITFEQFVDYFKGTNWGYAIRIKDVARYDDPIPLSDYGIKRPPQNFMYLED